MSSNFDSLIRNNKTAIVGQTLKVPTEIDLFAKDIAEYLEVSKHEVLIALLRDGAEIARLKQANLDIYDFTESQPEERSGKRYFMLNTNKSQDESTHDWMVSDKVAAAFCDPWKFKIERINPGDVVFHYESGAGIIGFGTVEGNIKKKEYDETKDDCYFYSLTNYHSLENPVPAKRVKDILKRKIPFASTLICLKDGEYLEKKLPLEK
ncbi:TPA: hypothetical protein ACQQX6_001647 [Yersinia enterocolitica]|uniref:hypothetical protein n=1 Tax=Yersinia enterocolitica TaxID=630 RepID=UPI0003D89A2D|nr:hypothetical protein [Yersinia enterocolitica]EKN3610721.1 hypothetical protein [Yersinia enterocolitica]ELW8237479.1 hypothetical protein [Yersinia enterocolitica]EME3604236.1 hypothetical protein [Yersinia enterocolitica]MDN0100876.1 hypothetical protein [Yersinia enterocolitica]UYJ78214.1 hypothetical protein N4227_07705 [Yersinia enterocolitica]